MALAAATVWEVRTAGSDTLCSGGYVTGSAGTDYSQQNAAQYTGTDLVLVTSTTISSATHNFVTADVGNLIQITAGTNFTTGFYQIVSVAANVGTIDRSGGTSGSTGGTFAVGGALKSPALACSPAVTENTIWVKSGTYTISSTTSNIALGRLTPGNQVMVRGYQTTRGDDAARPVLQASGIATTTLVTMSNFWVNLWNIEVDGAGLTAIKGFDLSGVENRTYYCVARNCTNNGFNRAGSGSAVVRCLAAACTTQYAFSGSRFFYCQADACTAGGFTITNSGGEALTLVGCIASNITGIGFTGGAASGALSCTAYACSSAGFSFTANPAGITLINCISYGNATYGFETGTAGVINFYQQWNCAAGNNTTANRRGTPPTVNDTSFITLTADPFVNAAGGNFALNNTAGGGAALRAAGIPGASVNGSTTSYLDVGAAQHQEPASSSGSGPNIIVSSGAASRGASW